MVGNKRKSVKKNRYSIEQKSAAIEQLKIKSCRKVSKELGIPLQTLLNWKNNPNMRLGSGHPNALTPEEENLLVEALDYTSRCGFPQTRDNLKDMVMSYVTSMGKNTPFKNNRPARDWVLAFERRHKDRLRHRKREGLSSSRASGLTSENVQGFFKMFGDLVVEKNLQNKPWCYSNCDEVGVMADKTEEKVIVGAGMKNAYSLKPDGTKTMYTVLVCSNAVGQFLPPFTIYKAKYIYGNWCDGGVEGAAYGISESGWMTDTNFEAWFLKIYLPYSAEAAGSNHRILIFDGHNSHITYRTVKAAMDNDVSIVCLPPHCSHALQPLDVAVFRSFKVAYSKACQQWFRTTKYSKIDKPSFPAVLKQAWGSLDSANVLNGFKKTGLYPLNKDAVNDKIVIDPIKLLNQNKPDKPTTSNTKKDPTQLMIDAVTKVLQPDISEEFQAALNNKKKPRKRVQAKTGEILTKDIVLERLLVEQEEREKKKKVVTKKKAKATSSGVKVTLRPKRTPAKVVTGSTLDTFVTRSSPTSSTIASSDDGDVQESVAPKDTSKKSMKPKLIQKGLQDFFGKSKKASKEKSVYRDTTDLSTDDPESDSSISTLPSHVLREKLQAEATHVIFNKEGTYFPGLVTRIKKSSVVIKSMVKSGTNTWSWPKPDSIHYCQLNNIYHIIPPPTLLNNRGKGYFVQKISQYW